MSTCVKCGTDLSSTATLSCSECHKNYCRDHYHDHDCTPEKTAIESTGDQQAEKGGMGSTSPFAALGYIISAGAAMVGLFYLLLEINVVIAGGRGIEAFQAVIHLAVAGTFFSLATFVLVATYISTE